MVRRRRNRKEPPFGSVYWYKHHWNPDGSLTAAGKRKGYKPKGGMGKARRARKARKAPTGRRKPAAKPRKARKASSPRRVGQAFGNTVSVTYRHLVTGKFYQHNFPASARIGVVDGEVVITPASAAQFLT